MELLQLAFLLYEISFFEVWHSMLFELQEYCAYTRN